MNKNLVSTLFKSILFGIVWASIAFVLAIILVKLKHYNLKDILFIEGIVLIAISILSSIGGNPTGLSMQGINNPTLTSYANLEITKAERKKSYETNSFLCIRLNIFNFRWTIINTIKLHYIKNNVTYTYILYNLYFQMMGK